MPELSTKEVEFRFKSAMEKKELWTPLLRDAYDLLMPMRNPYRGEERSPSSLIDRMYESTAMQSTFRLANKMLLEMVPPEQIWFDLKPGPVLELEHEDNKQLLDDFDKYLSKIVRVMAMVFQSGSFITAIHEAFLDMSILMGVLLVLEDPTNDDMPVMFECVPQNQVAIDEGPGGVIDGVYRQRKQFDVRRIEKTWHDAKIPSDIQKMIDGIGNEKKEAKIDLMECSYKAQNGKEWIYQVMWKKDGNDPIVLVERSYTTNPWIPFRWSKVPGSPYGPGPGLLTLPDVRVANRVMEMQLKNAALALAGMYLVADDGVINPENIQITNGGLIPVARTGGNLGASIAPLETGRNFDLSQILLDDLRTQIKKGLLDNALPPLEGAVRSATEIIQRMRELTQEFGGAMGRLINELIVPLVRRVADILSKRGYIDPVNINQYLIKVQVNSPLARAQQMQEVQNVVQWLEMTMQLGGQEAMMLAAKIEDIIPWIADKIGVPAELIRDEDEREQLQQYVAQIIAAQQMQVANNNGVSVARAA